MPEELATWIDPKQITEWAVMLGKAILILIVGWMIARWASGLVERSLTRSKVDLALARFLGAIARYTLIFATLIAAAGALAIETTSLTAIFASAGLAVGLALQGSLANFAAGVMILFFRPFTIGDVITVSGTTGKVTEIGLFATVMMLPDATKVIVPNGQATGSVIHNHTVMAKRRVSIDIGVDYGSDLAQVRAALCRAAESVPELLKDGDDPGYAVYFQAFGGSSLDWKVHVWSSLDDFLLVQEKAREAIYRELDAAGIGIPFPQLDVHLDGGLAKD